MEEEASGQRREEAPPPLRLTVPGRRRSLELRRPPQIEVAWGEAGRPCVEVVLYLCFIFFAFI
jgi:hypothetical protein